MIEEKIYEHNSCTYVRYYMAHNGMYRENGRMIYETVPEIGDIIHPFSIRSDDKWRVVDVKFPHDPKTEKFCCMDIYYENVYP